MEFKITNLDYDWRKNLALDLTTPYDPFLMIQAIKCTECKINTTYDAKIMCYKCQFMDIKINNQFELVYTIHVHEFWKCKECNYCHVTKRSTSKKEFNKKHNYIIKLHNILCKELLDKKI